MNADAFDATSLALALSDERGVPRIGRRAELAALADMGGRDPSLGRVYEGHVNGVQLVARCGSAVQRADAERDVRRGRIFAVWNTQDSDALRIVAAGDRYLLAGSKTWASGAGSVSRPIVTAAWPDGSVQMCLVPMERIRSRIDPSEWRPLGMHGSDSYRVSFDGVSLAASALIGAPGDYERQPWFHAGALRFAAVHAGIVARLLRETVAYLASLGRDEDALQRVRVAEMRIASHVAWHWIEAGAAAWEAFDASPSAGAAAHVRDVVDMARTAVERAGLDTIERAIRCVGARGLVEPLPFAGLVRDLEMYLRQPAPDAALLRVGATAFAEAARDAARSTAVATSTGTGA
jgi:alkylation response protein AidB-like acyl-CoA dehydrogenase